MNRARALQRSALVAAAVALAFGCASGGGSLGRAADAAVVFDSATARIITASDTVRLLVEIASTRAQQEVGLMDRPSLDANSGLLFVFDTVQDSASGFWMFRTRMPLDVAFIDAAGRIAAIRAMTPCPFDDPDDCDPYIAGVAYSAALEVNRGFFARHGIDVGARFELEPRPGVREAGGRHGGSARWHDAPRPPPPKTGSLRRSSSESRRTSASPSAVAGWALVRTGVGRERSGS